MPMMMMKGEREGGEERAKERNEKGGGREEETRKRQKEIRGGDPDSKFLSTAPLRSLKAKVWSGNLRTNDSE